MLALALYLIGFNFLYVLSSHVAPEEAYWKHLVSGLLWPVVAVIFVVAVIAD